MRSKRSPHPEFMAIGDAAEYLRVSTGTVWRMVARGDLPEPRRLGRAWVHWKRSDLERLLDQVVAPVPPRGVKGHWLERVAEDAAGQFRCGGSEVVRGTAAASDRPDQEVARVAGAGLVLPARPLRARGDPADVPVSRRLGVPVRRIAFLTDVV
jgi:excisionase family DNA binding protein